jgi:hypothetical protein
MGTLHENLSHSILLRIRNVLTKVAEKIKMHFLCSTTFFFLKIVPFIRQCGKIWYSHTGHRHNVVHALCILDTKSYGHTLKIYNTLAFPRQQLLWEPASVLR